MSATALFPVPLIVAPMAGGPSTPELAAAVAATGATGFLAGGMRAVDSLVADYREAVEGVRSGSAAALTIAGPVGVNLFVPEAANTAVPAERRHPGGEPRRRRAEAVARYREELLPETEDLGVELPHAMSLDPDADDGWDEKIAAAERERWPLVTFTFGLPATEVFERLHASGARLGATVTSVPEAVGSLRHGADFLVVQGPEAGGHRSVHDPAAEPPGLPLDRLLTTVRQAVGAQVPLVASGGIATAEQVRRLLAGGADAVQCGTAFLRCPEAGTHPVHRAALAEAARGTGFSRTAVTRAFSGRYARSLGNGFIERHTGAQAAYPEINALTGPLRRAANAVGDPDRTSLWAGVRAAEARELPAADIVASLLG